MIAQALSTDPDLSVFSPDDFSLSTTDISSTGGLSSDLFAGSDSLFDQADWDSSLGTDTNSANLDSQWFSFDDSDPNALEASCVGGGTSNTIGKVRREEGKMCSPNSQTNNPDFSNLRFPTLMQIEQTLEGSQAKPEVNVGVDAEEDNNEECPKPYGRRVCCTGPGIQSHPETGIWDFVQSCLPCMCCT